MNLCSVPVHFEIDQFAAQLRTFDIRRDFFVVGALHQQGEGEIVQDALRRSLPRFVYASDQLSGKRQIVALQPERFRHLVANTRDTRRDIAATRFEIGDLVFECFVLLFVAFETDTVMYLFVLQFRRLVFDMFKTALRIFTVFQKTVLAGGFTQFQRGA